MLWLCHKTDLTGVSGITEDMNVTGVGRAQYFHLVVLFDQFQLKIVGFFNR